LERLDLFFSSDFLAEGALAGNVLPLTVTLPSAWTTTSSERDFDFDRPRDLERRPRDLERLDLFFSSDFLEKDFDRKELPLTFVLCRRELVRFRE